MITNIFILGVSIILLIKWATFATKYASGFAESFQISKYIVGLIIIAIISILPETFIAISSALEWTPELGLGTLFWSNVADLTLVFALIIFLSRRKSIKIDSKILKINKIYPFLLLSPVILGLDGHYGHIEGAVLVVMGIIFYYFSSKKEYKEIAETEIKIIEKNRRKNLMYLVGSIALLLIGSHFAVQSGVDIAKSLGISPILIGILVIGVGTTIPELLFSLKAIKQHDDSLAVGDLLGTVLADATIVIGILALVNPISFPQRIIYITGIFMIVASFLIIYCMKTGKEISKREGLILLGFRLLFILVEYTYNT